MQSEFSVIGKRIPRPDVIEKATGAAKYTIDLKLTGTLIGKVLRSPYPHAKILKIDTAKAKKLPGVAAVITIEDVPRKLYNSYFNQYKVNPLYQKPDVKDRYVLSDKARYVGDGIAAVAAVDKSTAEEALKLIEVEYEELPAVFDPIEAMEPSAPRIHDFAENNIGRHMTYPFATGDVEKGFQEADYVVEATFTTSKQKHCQLELDTCIASFDATGRLTVWTSCSQIHLLRRNITDIFDIPEGMIRVITPHIGGAFGGKSNFTVEPLCIALAKSSGKPVKLEYTVEEDFVVHMSRQPYIQTGKMGVKKDGTIIALQTRLIANGGAYYESSSGPTGINIFFFTALYRCPNIEAEADIVYTNIPISGGFRGLGNPQAMFVLEQLVDMAAEKIGMDPLEFRLKNYRRTGEPSWWPAVPISSCALDECIRVGAEKIGWKKKRAKNKLGVRRRGLGMSIMTHPS
ncbi:xanthine dehydrogenase family protein molybdopterin-binding subunit, partial [Chloroflexota bacterium]